MGSRYGQRKSESVCVDMERAVHAGNELYNGGPSNRNHNGGFLCTTEVEQGAAHEGWYPSNTEVGCTVCAATQPV